MATAAYRRPIDRDSMSSQQMPPNEARHQDDNIRTAHMDYLHNDKHMLRNPEGAHGQSHPYRSNSAATRRRQVSSSFSARAHNLPEGNIIPPEDYLTSTSPSIKGNGASTRRPTDPEAAASGSARQMEDVKATSPVDSVNQISPLSRSSTLRSSTSKQHDWAPDRSPLQKLEVTLNGISKEEKRARVLEAEMKLKERLARQQMEAENRNASLAQPTDSNSAAGPIGSRMPQQSVSQRDVSQGGQENRARNTKQSIGQNAVHQGYEATIARDQGAPRQAKSSAQKPEPPALLVAPEMQTSKISNSKPLAGPVLNHGSVPRRSVSVTNRPGGHTTNTTKDPNTSRDGRDVPAVLGPSQKHHAMPSVAQMQHSQQYADARVQQSRAPQRGSGGNDPYAQGIASQQPEHLITNIHNAVLNDLSQDELGSHTKPKRNTVSFNVPPPTPPPLSEWKNAPVARLGASDFDFQHLDVDRSKAWWEGGGNNRRKSRALPSAYQKPVQKLTENKSFQPPIFLKCGPLLRYTGLKRVSIDGPNGSFDKETWRGSIMIVTKDSRSSYESPPTLRLFSQPMDLLPPPPVEVSGAQLAPEYVDPTAGLMKLGRDGRPLYVKPIDHTEEGLDLSFVENDDGVYEMSPSNLDYSSDGVKQSIPADRLHSVDGETVGAYKEVPGARLYADTARDVTFWRFNIEIELGETQQRIAYRLNRGPALGFWVPARGQSMNIMFHSCNGFSLGVDSNKFCGPDPLWRDVLNEHQTRPFHVMVGGGDQIFNDKVMVESPRFHEWVKIKNLTDKYDTPFDPEFRAEIESFYLENYSAWFSQGLFSLANSQIPMVNIWNDHDIIEGFGSYPDEFMATPVISGLGRIAFKYYLLFQHHSVTEETEADEPSWLLGAQLGPYINQRSRNVFMSMGKEIAFLGLDCRTERLSDEILSEQTCDLIWDRCHREIAMLKNILNSRKSLGKAGFFGGFVNKNGSKVEIFDDHWTAKHHKAERTYLLEDLQDLAAEKSVRVTILSGDVHLAAIGQFYSNPKLNLPKDKDYRYMPNVISSAIADMPETEMVSDVLNKRNHIHHLDTNTDEDMIPIFTHDVNSKPRNNKRLLPRRNWCAIREYQPGSTPPGSPESEEAPPPAEEPRPGKLQRTLSLGRGDRPQGGLLRRLSLRGPPPTKEFNLGNTPGRRMSMDGPFPPAEAEGSYFPAPEPEIRPGPFHRRPTTLSQKAAKKATKRGDDGVGAYVNLEKGLAITLNLELNPQDPSGITTPYKLLVPMLRYEGTEYDPPANPVAKGWKKWLAVGRKKERGFAKIVPGDVEDTDYDDDPDYEEGYAGSDLDEPDERLPEQMVRMGHAPGPGPVNDGPEETIKRKKKWFGRLV
ncbi:uncharacterized protein YGR266W [Aspergillus udagawae]|uniref:Uncharacterized protein YGR266W n=1 Tax=Aspergillus udagawae TaxID=91492 RepID=A0ABQ1ABD6_9EURO|nr:uncharacterized protein YGR266W [Aspergillus udagawae]GFF78091.1 uncharacterized protein YGR266W [Aspergillus udagawae]GFG05320.1 uncharacterized protein YGR266W [Aspergillus udagawae]